LETIKGEILSWMKTFKPNDMLCSDIVELWILSVIGLSWLSELYLENWYTQFCTEWCCFLKCRGSPLFFKVQRSKSSVPVLTWPMDLMAEFACWQIKYNAVFF
jgi:hypothetical protein